MAEGGEAEEFQDAVEYPEGGEEEAEEEVEQEPVYRPTPFQPMRRCYFRCQRIDELARPFRRKFLALYQEHADHLPPDKLEHLKLLLQELYAMTPEETMRYFADLKAAARARALRKRFKQKLRKILRQRRNAKLRAKALKRLKKVLRCGMKYAAFHEVPPLVSSRLRFLSDLILEQLCELREVCVCDRDCPDLDKLGRFLISVSDWMAVAIERLFYVAQLRREIDFPGGQHETTVKTEVEDPFLNAKPLATSTPRQSAVRGDSSAFLVPLATSTPRESLKKDPFQPKATSTPRTSLQKDTFQPKATSTPRQSRS